MTVSGWVLASVGLIVAALLIILAACLRDKERFMALAILILFAVSLGLKVLPDRDDGLTVYVNAERLEYLAKEAASRGLDVSDYVWYLVYQAVYEGGR